LALETCGGAVLFVNGREAGWIAGYVRNLVARSELVVDLAAGENELLVWFDDLAERDARYFFELDYLDGPDVAQALPVPIDGALAGALEAALDSMHFEQPTYTAGAVTLRIAAALPAAATLSVASAGFSRELPLAAGATRLAIADVAEWPAGF